MALTARNDINEEVRPSSEVILEIRDLDVHYGAIHALKRVSLLVGVGEIVALIGSNGAGKSTLLKSISGLLRPSAGDILFQGAPLAAGSPGATVRSGIAHVPEGRGIFGNLSVVENLSLGAYLRHDRQEIERDLAHVYSLFPVLKERHDQQAGTLSGGEQQMLSIGRGLMMKPKVLLLDEPSLGLAPLLVRKIFQIIETINREGVTILLVEQNANLALKVANRGYVLETGRIVLDDAASSLLTNESVRKAYLGD